ncbi:cytochrome P450 [Labedaea rhizosphaerae]|uniref:Cytochrome P450 n=1 Tax=Labedaea rhizosphaerae TaxID=598644 RepID=A0A4V3D0B8_LABRH|nr:cytochrome P450 [Labedaea rhizosphaerae]TDQ05155.1 cytochrome P450 [Labedaea rhizosphaerae]
MTTVEARSLPMTRTTPFDPPAELAQLPPISRLLYPDGHVGWLVTGHALAKEVLADKRFSSRFELRRFPISRGGEPFKPQGAQPGFFIGMDAPEHTRLRKLLTGQFTVRRMRQLEPRIEEITQARIEAMRAHGSPVDLVQEFALPIPSLVICELLGVDYADRDEFQTQTARLLDLELKQSETLAARDAVNEFMLDLVAQKRRKPADDIMSGLVQHDDLTDDELAGMGFLLLVAGHETTANMLGLGTMALLHDRTQWDALRADPSLVENAVEELLRYLTIVHFGTVRTAIADVPLGDVVVRAGDAVSISLPAANRDPSRFEEPDKLDLHRPTQGHLTFGHGIHQCLGQQLARIEMRIGYCALIDAFPNLRLAVEESAIPMRTRMAIYGVHRLPVEW